MNSIIRDGSSIHNLLIVWYDHKGSHGNVDLMVVELEEFKSECSYCKGVYHKSIIFFTIHTSISSSVKSISNKIEFKVEVLATTSLGGSVGVHILGSNCGNTGCDQEEFVHLK